jgi:hypothetical protein
VKAGDEAKFLMWKKIFLESMLLAHYTDEYSPIIKANILNVLNVCIIK